MTAETGRDNVNADRGRESKLRELRRRATVVGRCDAASSSKCEAKAGVSLALRHRKLFESKNTPSASELISTVLFSMTT